MGRSARSASDRKRASGILPRAIGSLQVPAFSRIPGCIAEDRNREDLEKRAAKEVLVGNGEYTARVGNQEIGTFAKQGRSCRCPSAYWIPWIPSRSWWARRSRLRTGSWLPLS